MIRSLRLYDVPVLCRLLEEPLAGDVGAVEPSMRLSSLDLVGLAAASPVIARHAHRRIFVDADRLRLRGFVHLARHRGGSRWEVTHLSHDGSGDAEQECTGLLEFACGWAASEGATKVVARVRELDDRLMLFHEVGFRKYAQETVLVLNGLSAPPIEGPIPRTRPFVEGDQWALHRLYSTTAPHGVQFVENLTSRELQFPTSTSLLGVFGGTRVTSEMLQDGPELVAAVATVFHRPSRAAELHVSMVPTASAEVERLLRRRLAELHKKGVEHVVTTVRHYETDTLHIVRRLGFEPAYSRAILVKHMAAHVQAPRLARVLERAPALPVVNSSRPGVRGSAPVCSCARREAPAAVGE